MEITRKNRRISQTLTNVEDDTIKNIRVSSTISLNDRSPLTRSEEEAGDASSITDNKLIEENHAAAKLRACLLGLLNDEHDIRKSYSQSSLEPVSELSGVMNNSLSTSVENLFAVTDTNLLQE